MITVIVTRSLLVVTTNFRSLTHGTENQVGYPVSRLRYSDLRDKLEVQLGCGVQPNIWPASFSAAVLCTCQALPGRDGITAS